MASPVSLAVAKSSRRPREPCLARDVRPSRFLPFFFHRLAHPPPGSPPCPPTRRPSFLFLSHTISRSLLFQHRPSTPPHRGNFQTPTSNEVAAANDHETTPATTSTASRELTKPASTTSPANRRCAPAGHDNAVEVRRCRHQRTSTMSSALPDIETIECGCLLTDLLDEGSAVYVPPSPIRGMFSTSFPKVIRPQSCSARSPCHRAPVLSCSARSSPV